MSHCVAVKHCDVAVIGGGIAGVAAAVQTARSALPGTHTVLIEKTIFLGGLATSGLVYLYLPLCDGQGNQILFGLAEELFQISMKYGPGNRESERYMGIFSPAAYILALDELLETAGVEVWYDTVFCKSIVSDAQIKAVELENKSGRIRLEASCFVDATGDGDVARSAGASFAVGYNTPAIWEMHYAAGLGKMKRTWAPNMERFCGNWREHEYEGVSGRVVSEFVQETRRRLRKFYQEKFTVEPDLRHQYFSMALPSMATLRRTYAIEGNATLCDANENTVFDDSVALICDWRSTRLRELPYGILLPKGLQNILTAGRCISSIETAWEWTRVIPIAAVTGQIAGLAAAEAARAGISPDQLNITTLQQQLLSLNFYLHKPEFINPSRKGVCHEESENGHIY